MAGSKGDGEPRLKKESCEELVVRNFRPSLQEEL
jgi:hypothetical protein